MKEKWYLNDFQFGAICAFLSTIVSIARRNMARNLASHMGGTFHVHSGDMFDREMTVNVDAVLCTALS